MIKPIILCIDDEKFILEELKKQLKLRLEDRFIFEMAETAEEALDLFAALIQEKHEIPVVICDYIMPGMRGDELLIRIHQIKPETLNILLTGQASIDAIGKVVNFATLYRYIAKPWEEEDLYLTVTEAIRSYYQSRTILKQNQELEELNASLEQKVIERTNELNRSLRQLEIEIAERKEKERRLQASEQQLRELNATKDKFFSIIAHDLKNPFGALINFSELLVEGLDDYSKDDILDIVQMIHQSSRHGYTLLENLLEWSRIQTGRIHLNPESFELIRAVDETVFLLNAKAISKNITVDNQIDPSVRVHADPNMTKAVIRNLVSNALKFTPDGGKVLIRSQSCSDWEQVSISDTGIGIRSEDLDKLFKIEVHHSTLGTAQEQGTGLGLILCKEFIEKNRGKIWVESQLKQGSTFHFTLPYPTTILS
ncbi:MAG: hybrid sensor histidine kinase/response regulator [Candidatus Delongbacteria bacterium]|nr:hybrid sensor histidine kinase/response regulator [Candidatus Delongbacteria bacterium]